MPLRLLAIAAQPVRHGAAPMSARAPLQFAKFLGVGVANTLIALLVIYAAKWLGSLGDVGANALGYGVGLLTSFALNSRWTFGHRGPQLPALARFLLVALVAYGMNLLTVMAAIHCAGLNGYLAQALGIPPYTVTSFLASKYLVFRPGPASADEPNHGQH